MNSNLHFFTLVLAVFTSSVAWADGVSLNRAPAEEEDVMMHLDCPLLVESHSESPYKAVWPEIDKPTGNLPLTFKITQDEYAALSSRKIMSVVKSYEMPAEKLCMVTGEETKTETQCPRSLKDVAPGVEKIVFSAGLDTSYGVALFFVTMDIYDSKDLLQGMADEVEVLSEVPEIGQLTRYQLADGQNSFVNYSFSCKVREASEMAAPSRAEPAPQKKKKEPPSLPKTGPISQLEDYI